MSDKKLTVTSTQKWDDNNSDPLKDLEELRKAFGLKGWFEKDDHPKD